MTPNKERRKGEREARCGVWWPANWTRERNSLTCLDGGSRGSSYDFLAYMRTNGKKVLVVGCLKVQWSTVKITENHLHMMAVPSFIISNSYLTFKLPTTRTFLPFGLWPMLSNKFCTFANNIRICNVESQSRQIEGSAHNSKLVWPDNQSTTLSPGSFNWPRSVTRALYFTFSFWH